MNEGPNPQGILRLMSDDDKFSIHHDEWLGCLFYWDGPGRSIYLTHASEFPPEVQVPIPEQWRAWAPEWAHERRELILQRLRDAGYRVIEEPFRQVPMWDTTPLPEPPSHAPMLLGMFGCLIFAVLGIFIALEASSEKDLWIAILIAGFFGFGAIVCGFKWYERTGPGLPPPRMRWVPDSDQLKPPRT